MFFRDVYKCILKPILELHILTVYFRAGTQLFKHDLIQLERSLNIY